MNNYQKMRKANSKIKEMLSTKGYFDFWMVPHTRHSKDMFGLWDCVCKQRHIGDNQFKIVFCQFKSGYAGLKAKRKLKEFCEASGQVGILVEYVKKKVVKSKRWKYSYKITNF